MSPLAVTIIGLVAKYGPEVVKNIIAIAHKPSASVADWTTVLDQAAKLDYDRAISDAEARAAK